MKNYIDLNIKNVEDENILLNFMVENPILIQRPILISNEKAYIARPPKKIEDIINEF